MLSGKLDLVLPPFYCAIFSYKPDQGHDMQTINISDFRANLLKYRQIVGAGEQISITSNGRLPATITAPAQQRDAAKKKLKARAGRPKFTMCLPLCAKTGTPCRDPGHLRNNLGCA